MTERSRIAMGVGVLLLLTTSTAAVACSYAEPPQFVEVLRNSVSAAVVRVEQIQLKDKGWRGPHQVVFLPELEAEVRVAETLFGKPALVKMVEYSGQPCGGHNLIVGEYYVLLIRANERRLILQPDDRSILPLFSEYDESVGAAASQSRLLMHFRNFVRLGSFPETFPIQKYFDHNRVRSPLPPRP
jgi:hypothetical protein